MNFLAHILLSGDLPGVLMGNYVGDFVKGRLTPEKTSHMNPNFVLGLKLHRFIDSYTDTHPEVQEAKRRAAQSQGKLAGIVMDIYFDHFIARNFADYHPDPLPVFVHNTYSVIEKNEYLVPESMVPMVRSMIRQDWLSTYATLEGIDVTFGRLSQRADFLAPIRNAGADLRANLSFYHEKFLLFYPQLEAAASDFIMKNG